MKDNLIAVTFEGEETVIETLENRCCLSGEATIYVGNHTRFQANGGLHNYSGLAGVTVFLNVNNRDRRATTGSDGIARFSGLRDGDYEARLESLTYPFLDAENLITTFRVPTPSNVLVPGAPWYNPLPDASGYLLVVKDVPAANSLLGTVFVDKDRSGTVADRFNDADQGIAGVRVYLDTNENGKREKSEISTLTDSSGRYWMRGMTMFEQTASIRITLPVGFENTTSSSVQGNERKEPSFGIVKPLPTSAIRFKVYADNSAPYTSRSLQGGIRVYLDLNRDGVWNKGEPRQTTVEGAATEFKVLPGKYRMRAIVPPTLKLDRRHTDVVVGDRESRTRFFTLSGNQTTYVSFFLDRNKNERRDEDEPLLRYGARYTIFSSIEYSWWGNQPHSLQHDSRGIITLVEVPGTISVRFEFFLTPEQRTPFIESQTRPSALPIDSLWEIPIEYLPPFWSDLEIAGT